MMNRHFRKSPLMIVLVLFLFVATSFQLPPAYAGVEAVDKLLDDFGSMLKESPLHKLRVQALKNHGLLINPYFKAGFELTNNVFGAPNSRHDGTVWTFTPGVNITHTGPYGQAGISYEAPFRYFTKFGMQNEQDQSFSAFVDLHPTDNLRIQVSEDLLQQGSTAGAPGVEPLNFVDNTVGAVISYDMDPLTAEFGYQNFGREYAGDLFDRFSYLENKYHVKSYYAIDENTTAHTGYILGYIDYDETGSRNATYHEFPVGVRTTIGGFFVAATLGVHIRNQEAATRNDFWAFVTDILVKKQITKRTSAEVGFLRRPVEATFSTAEIYDEKMFYGNVLHSISPRLRGRANISYANRDFEARTTVGAVTAKRHDNVFGIGVSFDYAMRKWLVFNLGYQFNRKDSSISDFDSMENRMTLGMTIPV